MSIIKTQTQFKCKPHNKCTFVDNAKSKEDRKDIFLIIRDTNKLMKEEPLKYPWASAMLVGSSKRSMVYIKSENDKQYDHDIQNKYNSTKNLISDKNKTDNLRNDFIKNFKKTVDKLKKSNVLDNKFEWNLENSTSAITVTKTFNGVLETSFDIAFINTLDNGIHKMDKTNPKNTKFIWNKLGNFNKAYQDAKTLKLKNLKEEYLKLKCNQKDLNKNHDDYKSSSSLFIEAVNNCKNQPNCQTQKMKKNKSKKIVKSKKVIKSKK